MVVQQRNETGSGRRQNIKAFQIPQQSRTGEHGLVTCVGSPPLRAADCQQSVVAINGMPVYERFIDGCLTNQLGPEIVAMDGILYEGSNNRILPMGGSGEDAWHP